MSLKIIRKISMKQTISIFPCLELNVRPAQHFEFDIPVLQHNQQLYDYPEVNNSDFERMTMRITRTTTMATTNKMIFFFRDEIEYLWPLLKWSTPRSTSSPACVTFCMMMSTFSPLKCNIDKYKIC